MTLPTDTRATQTPGKSIRGPLLRYRVMAFTTGTVLISGTIALILQKAFDVSHLGVLNAILWVGHGYCYLIYVIVSLQLALRMRWSLIKMVLVMAAGTIPTMSFVAEHIVTKQVRRSGMV